MQRGEPGCRCHGVDEMLGTRKKAHWCRCDVRWNYACACALAGRLDACRDQLMLLATWGAIASPGELSSDPDLAAIHATDWFHQLVGTLAAQSVST